jgi:3-dehydroquinate dehydratase-2
VDHGGSQGAPWQRESDAIRAAFLVSELPHRRKKDAERMSARLLVLNGPNLNLLGVREPHIYGATTLAMIEAACRDFAGRLGVSLDFHQSNHEGALVDLIQQARGTADAIVINPAAYSFTSIAIIDALKAFEGPIIELHISNIHARDELHRHSKISAVASVVICGAGAYGYLLAMQAAAQLLGCLPASLASAALAKA